MSTEIIMYFAIGVFILMAIGIILTMIEFTKISEDPSIRKGAGSSRPQPVNNEEPHAETG